MKDIIKKYDKMLFLKKKLDGSVELKRKSQFYKTVSYDVLKITNQYLGSRKWIISRLIKMDSRRRDLMETGITRRKKTNQDIRVADDVARFIQEGNKIVI